MIKGFICINKPKGVSSFYCVKTLKALLPKKTKVGHAGTLDPFASGLLIIGIGREATRVLNHISKADKEYVATGKLGELTDTFDVEGKLIKKDEKIITENDLLTGINNLGSEYLQTPPAFSALKYEGKPLYRLARKNVALDFDEILKTKRRMVTIHRLELLSFSFPFFTIRTVVSHGTYIRSLLNDIAKQSETVATTYELERSSIGLFSSFQGISVDTIKTIEDIETALLSVDSIKELLGLY